MACSSGLHASETNLDIYLIFIDIFISCSVQRGLVSNEHFLPPFTVKLVHSYHVKKAVVYIHKMLGICWITAMVKIQIS